MAELIDIVFEIGNHWAKVPDDKVQMSKSADKGNKNQWNASVRLKTPGEYNLSNLIEYVTFRLHSSFRLK